MVVVVVVLLVVVVVVVLLLTFFLDDCESIDSNSVASLLPMSVLSKYTR